MYLYTVHLSCEVLPSNMSIKTPINVCQFSDIVILYHLFRILTLNKDVFCMEKHKECF